MLYDYVSILLGMIKICILKFLYCTRIKFTTIPKINSNFCLALGKKTKLIIGKNFKCRNNVNIRNDKDGTIRIGDNVFFNDNVSINCQKSITIGNNVSIGHNVLIIDHDHDYKNDMKKFITAEVKIGDNVWIGANVTILKGVHIGDNVVIGANTLINKDIASNQVIVEKRDYIFKANNKGEKK